MKKNFINPEIKISLFNQERVRTDPTVTIAPVEEQVGLSNEPTNFNNALKWLENSNGLKATNIISFKE